MLLGLCYLLRRRRKHKHALEEEKTEGSSNGPDKLEGGEAELPIDTPRSHHGHTELPLEPERTELGGDHLGQIFEADSSPVHESPDTNISRSTMLDDRILEMPEATTPSIRTFNPKYG